MPRGSSEVQQRLAQGQLAEVVALLREEGDSQGALALLEEMLAFGEAAALAQELGDLPRALANTLDAGEDWQPLREALLASSFEVVRKAAEVFEARGRWSDAAQCLEFCQEPLKAAALWRKHGDLGRAARCYQEAGEARLAGEYFEKHLAECPEDREAALYVGRLLLSFQQTEKAIVWLQKAKQDASLCVASLEALLRAFDRLSYHSAASDCYEELRALRQDLPADIGSYLRTLRQQDESQATGRLLLGRYRLLRTLGATSTAQVLLARDEYSGREVAVKLFAGSARHGRDLYERFLREARVMSALSHPNIVRVFALQASEGFLVMEYLSGGTLEDRLQAEVPVTLLPQLITSVAGALEAAHLRGIVHRDVKPSNIFFGVSGEIKLGDFGVAHLQDSGATQTGGFLGTLAYMSPEQIAAAPISFAADQYSLGVMLYQLVCGVLPFVGPDMAKQHLVREPMAPSERRHGIPKELDPLLLRMLAKSPDDRYPSMAVLSAALLAFPWRTLSRESASVPVETSEPIVRGVRHRRGAQLRAHNGLVWYSTQDVWMQRDVIEECCVEESGREAWQRSVQRLAQCRSPFLQTLLLQEGSSIFWESLSGETLAERLRKGPIEKVELRRLLWAMASAVSSLHQVGESHGAISAETVLCSPLPLLLLSGRTGGTIEDDVVSLQSLMFDCLAVSTKDISLLWESLSLPFERRPERFPESAAALAALLAVS